MKLAADRSDVVQECQIYNVGRSKLLRLFDCRTQRSFQESRVLNDHRRWF